MATQPDDQFTTPEPQPDGSGGGDGIGAGALATAGLGLIALAILIWFIWPRFSGADQTTEGTPATIIAELITATPVPIITATLAPTEAGTITEAPTTLILASPLPVGPPVTLPAKVQTGIYAKVAGTEGFGLRFRSGPGEDFVTWRILPEGEILKITGGPEEVGGVLWWRAVDKTGLIGWAAEQFLVPVEPPVWTPEPERTPNLTELTPTPES